MKRSRTMHRYSQPFTILREGFVFAGCALLIAALLFPYGTIYAFPFTCFAGWVLYFFRDPERVPPVLEGAVVSAADGLILSVSKKKAPEPIKSDESFHCISIFMSIFDVHINRMPLAAKVNQVYHIPGKFFDAATKKADDLNERCVHDCTTTDGQRFVVVQIAGRCARRIKPYHSPGKSLKRAERFGVICFGSRVDIYLPESYDIIAREGQKTLAGETIVAQAKKS